MTEDLLDQALEWKSGGQSVAVATVVSTWGSSPRPVGSQLIINGEGQFVGSVSGGCIEGAVIVEAQEAMEDGRHRLLSFGVSDAKAWEVGLACGGQIEVFVERIEE